MLLLVVLQDEPNWTIKWLPQFHFKNKKKDHLLQQSCVSSDRGGALTGGTAAPHWSWLLEGTTANKLQVLLLPKEQWPVPTLPPESPMSWSPVIHQKIPWQILNSSLLWSTSLLSLVPSNSLYRQRLALPNANNHNGCFHYFSLPFLFSFLSLRVTSRL